MAADSGPSPVGRVERALLLLGLLAVLSVPVVRGIRLPNDWAEAHWLLHYGFGFIKRGLPGTLLQPLVRQVDQVELLLRIVVLVQYAVFIGALCYVGLRVVSRTAWSHTGAAVALVVASSPFVVLSANAIGYFDSIVFVLSALACAAVLRRRSWLAALLMSIAILVHESTVVVGYPAVLYTAALEHLARGRQGGPGALVRRHLPLLVGPALVWGALFIHQTFVMDGAAIRAKLTEHLAGFELVENNRHRFVPRWCTSPFTDSLDRELPRFLGRITDIGYLAHHGVGILLLGAFLLLRGGARRRLPLMIVPAAGIALLPLAMHAVAYDTSRIWTYPIGVTVLLLWVHAELGLVRSARLHGSLAGTLYAFGVVAGNLFQRTPLLDRVDERLTDGWRVLLYLPPLLIVVSVLGSNARPRTISRRS